MAETAAGRLLLTGDVEEDGQRALLRSKIPLRADVLKVPHHGSRTTSPEFLDAVRPRVALVSVGPDNTFGHPNPGILQRLAALGAVTVRTDRDGEWRWRARGPGRLPSSGILVGTSCGEHLNAADSLHLVLGDEEFLVERAVASVIAAVREAAGSAVRTCPFSRLRAGDASAPELAELLSPSLFAEDRVVVLEAAAEAGKDAVALVQDAAADLPEASCWSYSTPAAVAQRRWRACCRSPAPSCTSAPSSRRTSEWTSCAGSSARRACACRRK